ncbi:hypothetical protein FBU30_009740 [Linnemannia zychae]|nr:hypothetical protein FBU30_009740 [Linnemannia zychae]
MRPQTFTAFLWAISVLVLQPVANASTLTDGVYTIRSQKGFYILSNNTTPGNLVDFGNHSMDAKYNPYRNDEPLRMQKEPQDWYLDSTSTTGYFEIESPVMGHQEKAYAIKTPDDTPFTPTNSRGFVYGATVTLPDINNPCSATS